jgi:hypothetical protein
LKRKLDQQVVAQSVSKRVEEAVPLSRISTNQIFIGGIAA